MLESIVNMINSPLLLLIIGAIILNGLWNLTEEFRKDRLERIQMFRDAEARSMRNKRLFARPREVRRNRR